MSKVFWNTENFFHNKIKYPKNQILEIFTPMLKNWFIIFKRLYLASKQSGNTPIK